MTESEFTYVLLTAGILIAFLLFFSRKRIKFVDKYWPQTFGLVMGSFLFVSLIFARCLFFPTTDLLKHLASSFFLSAMIGVEVWISFGIIDWIGKRRKK